MADAIVECGFTLATEVIGFLQQSMDDWIQVVPEANEFLRDCEHFVNVIKAKLPAEEVEKLREEALSIGGLSLESKSNEAAVDDQDVQDCGDKPESSDSEAPHIKSLRKRDRFRKWIVSPMQYCRTYPINPEPIKSSNEESSENLSPEPETPTPQSYEKTKEPVVEHHGEDAIIREIFQRIFAAQNYLRQFLAENDAKKNFKESVKWKIKRAQEAGDLRSYFRDESNAIRSRLNDLILCQKISDDAANVELDQFKADMTDDAYAFWKKFFGQKVKGSLCEFIDAYNMLYTELMSGDREYIEKSLGSKSLSEQQVTVFGFINFTRKHGFPFSQDIASSVPKPDALMSEKRIMELTRMVMELVADFSSQEMRSHLINVYTWFDGCSTEEEYQERANEWGRRMREARKSKRNLGDDYLEVDNIDLARRALSFFYQRFMVMWRVGKVSRETLSGVDFPGTGRIKDFIRIVHPLDRANFCIVMKKDESEWEEHKPKVYKFLEYYLKKTPEQESTQAPPSNDS